jgi:hypothetical protein
MNIKRERPPIQKSRLENEVILAVVILYVLLSAALLAIHHIQPEGTETKTSSSSPSHSEFSTGSDAPDPASAAVEPLTLTQAHQLLTRDGFQEIRGIREGGKGFQATAIKEGKTWEVEVDARTRQISRARQAAH